MWYNVGMTDMNLSSKLSVWKKQRQAKGSGRKNWLVLLLVVAVLSAGLGAAASFLIISPEQQKMQTASPKPTLITSPVQLKKIENTVITRGTIKPTESYYIGYGQMLKTGSTDKPGSGEILTSVAVKVGDEINAGTVLADVNEKPVIVMQGDITMYRDIHPGIEGTDVKQLQENLRNLGFYHGAISGVYNSATWSAVEQFYKNKGYKPDMLDVPTTPEQQKADPNVQPTKAPIVPKTQLQFIKQAPCHVSSVASDVGFGVPEVVAILTPTALEVQASVPSNQEALIHKGDAVSLYLSDANVVPGKVGDKTAAKDGDKDSGAANFTLIPDQAIPFDMTDKDIKVTFTTASTADKVFTVPLGAISSDASGTTYINLVGDNDAITRVNAKTGVSGNGEVQITPDTENVVKEGSRVLIGQ
ncbi:MAG: peptidoglycan-binding protein [Candidatus Ancillula sp.]|jgi:peptidoglycan hydrolase-like protein with peptidoglycan-binding domain|nr:peptidoglycan-binding protein [Candidatus Ancillula sp.]